MMVLLRWKELGCRRSKINSTKRMLLCRMAKLNRWHLRWTSKTNHQVRIWDESLSNETKKLGGPHGGGEPCGELDGKKRQSRTDACDGLIWLMFARWSLCSDGRKEKMSSFRRRYPFDFVTRDTKTWRENKARKKWECFLGLCAPHEYKHH